MDHSKEFIHASIDFHIRIAEITDNPILQALTKSLLSWLLEYYKLLLYWAGHENTTLNEHEIIVQALGAND